MKHRSALILSLLIVVLLVSGCGLWQARRQYALNRQLIAALVRNDHKAALALVNAGADPNTRREATPAPTFAQLLRQLLHHSSPPATASATALQLACGDVLAYYLRQNLKAPPPPEDIPLVQAMLTHGADVHATNEVKQTALFCAVIVKHPRSAQLLLDYGANINAADINGTTPLMVTAEIKDVYITRLLLEHGASVTPADYIKYTALHFAMTDKADIRLVGMLLAHGADPYARNKSGETPLHMAQRHHRADLVALLRTGAK